MSALAASSLPAAQPGWEARLSLRFAPGSTRTRLIREDAFGPLTVQKPFYPEDPVCHVYLLHPPGGVAGGDRLTTGIGVDPGAAALITTPAATRLYRSDGPEATILNRLEVASDAGLEWLPQETILFGGARARVRTEVKLKGNARFIGWESCCVGREAYGDHYATGSVSLDFRLSLDDHPLLQERLPLIAGSRFLDAPWGFAGRRVLGSLYATPADADTLAALRASQPAETRLDGPDPLKAATLVDGLLIYRVLGHRSEAVRSALIDAWQTLRPLVIGRSPCTPRIWHT
jgi:urease accessory protein